LYVPPGTTDDEQQLALPLVPQIAARPVQLGGKPHTPAPQTGVEALHATAVPHAPLALHVCTPLPEHCVCPGPHTPWHEPLTHVRFVAHTESFTHPPLALHVCGCEPLAH
jgi:hypothetical protein